VTVTLPGLLHEWIVGVDPGRAGGIAFLDGDTTEAYKMPETRGDLIELLADHHQPSVLGMRPSQRIRYAYVERVRSSPQMGVTSAFTFGCNYERVVMALLCAGIPVEEVTPQRWQKTLGCLTGGDKKVSKARAQQLFPSSKVTNYVADALLIAHYGRLQLNGRT
jgi:hypothetical protein